MKIILFGSAFNPPHNGHVTLINEAVKQRAPDIVILVPTGNPVHKKIPNNTKKARLKMSMELAKLVGCKCLVSDYEIKRKKPSYTLDTLLHIKKKYPGSSVELLIGSDMLLYFSKWHRYTEIIKLCTVVAAARDDVDRRMVTSVITAINNLGGNALLMPINPVVISSGEIRRMVQQSQDFSELVPNKIVQIIKSEKLYRPLHLRVIAKHAEKQLSAKRYHHTLMVCKMAIKLANINGVNRYKACVAALLHDVAKEFSQENMLQLLKNSDIITKWKDVPFSIWHGFAGAEYAKQELMVLDEEILSAIRWHSTAKAGMSKLDKIIYLADMVSEDRDFAQLPELRQKVFVDLDGALLDSLKLCLDWLSRDAKPISPYTLQALEELKGTIIEQEE